MAAANWHVMVSDAMLGITLLSRNGTLGDVQLAEQHFVSVSFMVSRQCKTLRSGLSREVPRNPN